jgi:hypothetical protein
MNPSVIIPSEKLAHDWIEKNLERFIGQSMRTARHQKPLPLSVTMHGIARTKFIEMLKSESAYHPEPNGNFKFLGIPVYTNNRLPYGTFCVESFKPVKLLSKG